MASRFDPVITHLFSLSLCSCWMLYNWHVSNSGVCILALGGLNHDHHLSHTYIDTNLFSFSYAWQTDREKWEHKKEKNREREREREKKKWDEARKSFHSFIHWLYR